MQDVQPNVPPVMDKAERRALIERPARRRRWIRAAECYALGLAFGPLVSALVNHGQPVLSAATDSVLMTPLLGLAAVVATTSHRYGDSKAALLRALVILVVGSTLFVLPREATLAASGAPVVSWTVDLRWLICCVPYPLVADLIRPGCTRAGRAVPMASLAGLALVWPLLLGEMTDVVAAQTRASLGVPDAMFLFVDPPAPISIRDSSYTDGVLSLDFDSLPPSTLPDFDAGPDDLDMVVYPANADTPCMQIPVAVTNALGIGTAVPPSCRQMAPDRWQYTGVPDKTSTTQFERYGAYYVVLTVDRESQDPISPAGLPALFRTLHRPDTAEVAALGEATYQFWN